MVVHLVITWIWEYYFNGVYWLRNLSNTKAMKCKGEFKNDIASKDNTKGESLEKDIISIKSI